MKKVIAIVFLVLGIALVVLGAVGSSTGSIVDEATTSFVFMGIGAIIAAAILYSKYEKKDAEQCRRANKTIYLPPDESEDVAYNVALWYEALRESPEGYLAWTEYFVVALFTMAKEVAGFTIDAAILATGVAAAFHGYLFDGQNFLKFAEPPKKADEHLYCLTTQILAFKYMLVPRVSKRAAITQALCSETWIKRAIQTARSRKNECDRYGKMCELVATGVGAYSEMIDVYDDFFMQFSKERPFETHK